MSFDGVFIHHLVKEIKNNLINQRINKVYAIDKLNFIFKLSNHKEFLISINPESAHIRFTKMDYVPAQLTFPIYSLLKKYLESSIITNFYQVSNDRILIFEVDSFNDFGFSQKIKLVLELFGRNSNLLILDSEDIIIEAVKKNFELGDLEKRIIYPKVKYALPDTSDLIDPFEASNILSNNQYLGVSKLLYNEIVYQNNLDIIKQLTKPVLIKKANKYFFYCFELSHLDGEVTILSSLSELLEDYYVRIKLVKSENAEQKIIEAYLKKEINKVTNKLSKQRLEAEKAKENLSLEKTGNLLSANLYKVKKNMNEIVVEDFYSDNKEIVISLDPLMSPSRNLENIFSKFKKAKRAIIHIEEQIEATILELDYLDTLTNQLTNASTNEIKEILEELNLNKKKIITKRKQKPQIQTYKYDNAVIMVGKNNIQNNYLTHTLANKNDYFFHVKGVPGSHTILRCEELTNELITLAAHIAAIYSKNKNSENVPVDYTLVKNVKKVSKTKGSFVTYTNFKTVYVTPRIDYINEFTK